MDNPYWPLRLAEKAGAIPHERFVFLSPLALSLTQDDKGRVRWTLFGGSEQGPERDFWKSFFTLRIRRFQTRWASISFAVCWPPSTASRSATPTTSTKSASAFCPPKAGAGQPRPYAWSAEEDLPTWTSRYRCNQRRPAQGVKYLLTFRPFGRLPEAIQTAYLDGQLHLIPYPGSLIFWGTSGAAKMIDAARLAVQVPLLTVVGRHEAPHGLRVPQAGWMHEHKPGKPEPDHSVRCSQRSIR